MLIQTARTTDAPHMRNGFIKFLTDRLSREVALEAETKTRVLADLDFFRAEFPAGSFKTGQRILATRLPNTGYLQMEFPDRPDAKAFVVENALVGQWFFEGYLTTTRPISPALLQSVSQGLERLVKPQF